ncbi:MAG: alanine racemase [Planctomycetes bacterium]|nr:alanine racemase [Planctomycetota bacterium]
MRLEAVETPAVVIDREILRANIDAMARAARAAGHRLRPHFKTHKIPGIARDQIAAGACGMTVANPGEARVLFDAGIRDVFIARVTGSPPKLDRIAALAREGDVIAAVDGPEAAEALARAARTAGVRIRVRIEIDTGQSRSGLRPGDEAIALARSIASSGAYEGLALDGIFTHAGHIYAAPDRDAMRAIAEAEGRAMLDLARAMRTAGAPVAEVSIGSTPAARFAGAIPEALEIRPGNYVFHDAIQVANGTAALERCAMTVLATVIGRPAPDRAVLDAGSKILSSDRGTGASATEGFGLVLDHPAWRIERLSEEHGVARIPPGDPARFGDRVRILPAHACPVLNLVDRALLVSGDEVAGEYAVAARGAI